MSVEFIRLFLIRDNKMLALRLGARMRQGTFFFTRTALTGEAVRDVLLL